MLAHQRTGIVQARCQSGRNRLRRGRIRGLAQGIAQCHGNIAYPFFMANAADGAAFGAAQKAGLVPGKQLGQAHILQARAHRKIGQHTGLGKLVPGAGQLAIVTAIDAVGHFGAQVFGDAAAVLNRQVRDAAARIHLPRCDDGPRRAGIQARGAAAAVHADRLGRRQRQIDVDFAQKKGGTGLAVEHQAVLAAPALAAAPGQLGLEHRGRIGERAVAKRPQLLGHALGQFLQAGPQHLVVIAPSGIDRDDGLLRMAQALPLALLPIGRGIGRQVIHAGGDDADRAGHQLGRAGTLEAMRRHVVHLAVKALLQPTQQTRLTGGQIHTGDANLRKSQLFGPGGDAGQPGLACLSLVFLTVIFCVHKRPIVKMPDSPQRPQAHPGVTLTWSSEADTAAFAQQLAHKMMANSALAQAFITLHGNLGAGKTTLVRHLLQALGVPGRIKSPTYAVVEAYDLPQLAIWHFDFYRFDDPLEWEDAGFRDIFASPGLKLAEWPEKAAGLAPQADVAIHIEAIDDTQRRVHLRPLSACGTQLLQAWFS